MSFCSILQKIRNFMIAKVVSPSTSVDFFVTQPLNVANNVYSSRNERTFCAKKHLGRRNKIRTRSSLMLFCEIATCLFAESHVMYRQRKLPRTSKILRLLGFNSFKNEARMYCESAMESHALLLCEFDDSVLRYTTQPFTLTYRLNNRKTHYTPDILKKMSNGNYQSVEVKPLDRLLSVHNVEKFQVLQELFPKIVGHDLRLLSDKDIYAGGQIKNYQTLYPFRRQPLTDQEKRVLSVTPSTLSFRELSELSHSSFFTAMRLVAHNSFLWDVLSPLTPESLLRKRGA